MSLSQNMKHSYNEHIIHNNIHCDMPRMFVAKAKHVVVYMCCADDLRL